MESPLITTKLLAPKAHQSLVSRPALLDRLSAGFTKKLTLISASSGYGKTTLMAEWCAKQGRDYPLAWISLDKGDNDPVLFLSYLFAALQNIQDGLGADSKAVMQGAQNPPDTMILSLLINDLSAVQNDFALVLEDYHAIEAQEIHQMMVFLLEHLPPRMHVVILTRADPPFPLARFRARGELVEIRVRDLRFTFEDAAAFLNNMVDANISKTNIQTLLDRTEGWITGLQLAALSIQGRENPSEMISAFGGRHDYIVDYLIEEVLERQTDMLKIFLLQTSILSRLNGSICNAVTGQSDGDATLEYLEKANLFVTPLGGEPRWYRYHHLFADVMKNRLQRLDPGKIPELHLQAAKWFEQNNLIIESIEHALSANEAQYAADMLQRNALGLLANGNVSTLLAWFDRLPNDVIAERPLLSVFCAWALMLAGRMDNIEKQMATAENVAKSRNEYERFRGDIAAVRAYDSSRRGDMKQAKDLAHQALEWLTEDNYTVRSVMNFVLGGIYYVNQDIPNAFAAMREASYIGELAGNINVAVSALSAMGSVLIEQGDLDEAEKTYEKALSLSTGRKGQHLPIASSTYVGLARLGLARGDLESARHYAQAGVALGKEWENADSQTGGYLALAQSEHMQGNDDEAKSALEQAKHLAATHTLWPGVENDIAKCETLLQTKPNIGNAQNPLIEPLTERELEVLGLMAEGLSNPEIAAKLIIAVGTVKAHTSSIYGKLDVRSRTEAVIRGKELGVI